MGRVPRRRVGPAVSAVIAALCSATPAQAAGGGPAAAGVDFGRDVRPIFEQSCFSCHGAKKKGGLVMTSRAGLLKGGFTEPAIVPGKGADSYLVKRILGLGDEDRMPLEKPPLSDAQVAIVRRWIDEGAEWPESAGDAAGGGHDQIHWAYKRPERPPLPEVKRKTWVRNPVDAFVLARLEQAGLAPSPEAPRETLIRRLSLDLTGLPPSPAETAAFLADRRPDAYQRLVDRLLASPHHGERWARPWLDLARYADSHGYEKDRLRVAWKYRDWVIDALNANLSFKQFTIEQIAGDMLPGATVAQRIATGFHRNTMLNQEGGVDVEEAHWEVLVDRVGTTATVWLGTTLACTQCHNHKFDSFSQKDFYRFLAFFEGSRRELVVHPSSDRWLDEPDLSLPTPAQQAERERLEREIAALQARLRVETPEEIAAQRAWEAEVLAAEGAWVVARPRAARSLGGARLKVLPDGSVLASGKNPPADTYEVEIETDLRGITGVRIEALPDRSLPAGGPGRDADGNFFLTRVALKLAGAGGADEIAFAAALDDGHASGRKAEKLLDGKEPGWAVDVDARPRPPRWQAAFALKTKVGDGGRARLVVRLEHDMPRTTRALGRFRIGLTTAADPTLAAAIPARLRTAAAQPIERRPETQRGELAEIYLASAPAPRAWRAEIDKRKKAVEELGIVTAQVLEERPGFERPSTELRVRGSFMARGERVYAGTPEHLPPLPDHAPANRLGLAYWLVSEENPLTARVTVNRIWAEYFGHGIVETVEDFGTQASPPTHPELLDWLAVEFMQSGWDLKALHRTIVASATYRQSSRVTPELLERDPYNRLYARGARFRLDAEAIRDVALAASGLLSRKIGGPSVFPPQPEGIWDNPYSGVYYQPSEGEDRYRRGLYTFLRRTAPHPSMVTFDAPTREACIARRVRTNTPLQALTTLNDPVFFEAAQALARRVVTEGGADVGSRVAYLIALVLSRAPRPAEIAAIRANLDRQRARFASDREAASKVAGGAAKGEADAAVAERAAWTMVANAILNLDEALSKE